MSLPTSSDDLDVDLMVQKLQQSAQKKDNPLLNLAAALVVAQGQRDQLLALLKLIAETPEPKDTIQVWAWNAYEKGAPDAQ